MSDVIDIKSAGTALISDDGVYRYRLSRGKSGKSLVFIMLNPSTADASVDDPTIRRCIGFSRREGLEGTAVVNLYAYRATDPRALLKAPNAVGPENLAYLKRELNDAKISGSTVVCAWGASDPFRMGAVVKSLAILANVNLWCLGKTKSGAPKHPLYLKGDTLLERWP